jgi:hypothetical protein
LHPYFTLTLGDEVEFVWNLTLSDDHLLGVVHLQLHLREQQINQFLLLLKDVIFVDDVLENEFNDLFLERRADVLDKQG